MSDCDELERARQRVIESIAANMDLYGVTHSTGRLYGILYFSDRPLTLDEMGRALGMSKTSMSSGVRTLTDLKMVEKVWMKGERKDYYQAVEDWYQTFFDFFAIKWRKAVETNIESIRRSRKELEQLAAAPDTSDEVKQQASRDIAKLDHALEYYDWLSRLINCFESNEIFKLVPKQSGNGATAPDDEHRFR